MDIGSRIKVLRKQAGLTQFGLAEKAHISRSYLADVEKNRYNPSLDTLDKIIEALGTNKRDFFSEEASYEEKKQGADLFPEDFKPTKKAIAEHSAFMETVQAFFMDDEVPEEDKEDLFKDLSELYFDSRRRNREKYKKKK